MSEEKHEADSADLHYVCMTVFGIYKEVKSLSAAMEYPHLFELLQREPSLQELERAEALLSVCISQLRARKQIQQNSATIIRLHEGLKK